MTSNMFNSKIVKVLAVVVALIIIVAVGLWFAYKFTSPEPSQAPTNFQECAAKYKVEEGSPRTCKVPYGATYYEYSGNQNVVQGEIRLTNMSAAPVFTSSPVTITGEATSDWFGDKGLVVQLVSANGAVIGSATAKPDDATPATPGFKAFSVSITFTHPKEGTVGAIVLKKAGSDTTSVVPVAF